MILHTFVIRCIQRTGPWQCRHYHLYDGSYRPWQPTYMCMCTCTLLVCTMYCTSLCTHSVSGTSTKLGTYMYMYMHALCKRQSHNIIMYMHVGDQPRAQPYSQLFNFACWNIERLEHSNYPNGMSSHFNFSLIHQTCRVTSSLTVLF